MDTGKKLENYLREVCRKVGIRDGKCGSSVHELRHALLDYFRADEETVRAKRERRQQQPVASTDGRTADYSCAVDDEW